MSEEIIVEATPEGQVSITVQGVKGSSCKEMTKDLEKALGTVREDRETKEYHEKPLKKVQKVNQ
jgi:hypothetical protein